MTQITWHTCARVALLLTIGLHLACSAGEEGADANAQSGNDAADLWRLGQLQLVLDDTIVPDPHNAPDLTFEQGEVHVGDSATRRFTVRNVAATGDLIVRRVQLSYVGPPRLAEPLGPALMLSAATGPRGAIPLSAGVHDVRLGPGEQLDLTIRYIRYADAMERAARVVVAYDNAPDLHGLLGFGVSVNAPAEQRAPPRGDGDEPCIEVLPSSVQFGAKLVGHVAWRPVELRSCGRVALSVTHMGLAGDVSGRFGVAAQALPAGALPTPEAPLQILPGKSATAMVRYSPTSTSLLSIHGKPVLDMASLIIATNTPEQTHTVPLSGLGTNDARPTAVGRVQEGEQVIPQTNLHLFSDESTATVGEVARRRWTVEQPEGSMSVFIPSAAFPSPTFEANVAGTYVFSLDVWDEANTQSASPWQTAVVVVPDEAIHIELLWRTVNDPDETDEGAEAGSDLDLHFVHVKYAVGSAFDGDKDGKDDPWFHQPYDCFWFNPEPNWGTFDPTANDDPSLDRDDTDGAGPENLNLNVPQNGVSYGVGVHYWSDHEFGDAYATVRIYLYSNLVFEVKNVRLSNRDMWDVARIEWPQATATPVLLPGGMYKITSGYQNPYFGP